MAEHDDVFHLHLVSDSTGETIRSVARACMAQFVESEPVEHFWPMARTPKAMDLVLEEISENPGPVIFTLVDDSLGEQLVRGCRLRKVPCISVLDPVMDALASSLGQRPTHRVGGQHELDAAYFERIEAMDWSLTHDDGQRTEELNGSDIVLVGVSRTSKTPTCLYLANRGIKAANVPWVPGVPLPASLEKLTHPLVIGLTNDHKRLVELRRARLTSLHQNEETAYVDPDEVRAELTEARRYFARNGWPVIDVTRRSIEETAAAIMTLYQRRLDEQAGDGTENGSA
ncbi:MAG: phosphoenolpyruvate synthase regulatory protein [Alphaproteobacteria bacterium]|nr:phosphoenolpyruvate synthase regulatory protein [Alphaproteobacteria bacterium]|tara:strand:- start:1206 stop:2063 length:858 start_codon:yes stop_codon:yes gene_type:complete